MRYYKIGLIEDDLMNEHLIIERLNRVIENCEFQLNAEPIRFIDKKLEELVDLIYNEKYDAIVVDHKLKTTNSNINYEGTDIALAIEEIVHFFPVFILTSFPLAAEKEEFSDVNKVYSKDIYVSDEIGKFVETINLKIINQIIHYGNRIEAAEQELLTLKSKSELTNVEKDKLLELDHLIEKSICGRQTTPLSLKHNDLELQKLILLAESILNESDENNAK